MIGVDLVSVVGIDEQHIVGEKVFQGKICCPAVIVAGDDDELRFRPNTDTLEQFA